MKNKILFSFLFSVLLSLGMKAQTRSFSGNVSTEDGLPLSNVRIQIFDENGEGTTEFTDNNGDFLFEDLNAASYSVEVSGQAGFSRQDITILDVLLMSQHILGVRPLPSVYKQLAADVNLSGGITTFDMILIRRFILLDDNAIETPAWYYVPDVPNLIDLSSPDTTVNADTSVDLSISSQTANFIGVQVGNVGSL